MELLYYFYYSSNLLDLIRTYFQAYEQYIWGALLAVAVLNCFFGFHLRKLWGILAGMCLGAAISAGVCIYIGKTGTLLYLITILGAFTLGLLALLLYKAGLFFIGTLMVPLVLSRLFPTRQSSTLVIWIVLGLLTGTMTLIRERETISFLTAIGGGFGAAKCVSVLSDHSSLLTIFLIGFSLSLTGILLQFQPWRSRSSWNSDEERARDKHRHNRRMKRIRRKKKRQQRLDQRQENKRAGSRKQAGIHKRIGKRNPQRPGTTEYIPYTTRPLYQSTIAHRTDTVDPAASPSRPMPAPPTPASTQPEADLWENASPEPATALSRDPDLSNIRQQISQEVTDIYQEQQMNMDEALDKLLEKEFETTTRRLN